MGELSMIVTRVESDGALHVTPLGTMYPGNAVVFHEGSTLVVVPNTLRLLAYRKCGTTAAAATNLP